MVSGIRIPQDQKHSHRRLLSALGQPQVAPRPSLSLSLGTRKETTP